MRQFRAEGEQSFLNSELKISFDQKLQKSLKSVLRLLSFVDFAVNYGYAIENVWVTMLMITFNTPYYIDSFIWITPIVIAVLLRPYIIRYVHSINYKVYHEISVVGICMILGAAGCFLIGYSCSIEGKFQIMKRIFICSIGWTLMDFGFEMCQFFTQKIDNSFKELKETNALNQGIEDKYQQDQSNLNKKANFQFYGLFLGYIVSLLICWIIQGKSVKLIQEFYRCAKYAYWTVGGVALMTGMRLLMQSHLNLPKRNKNQEKQNEQKIMEISFVPSYYLPGLNELFQTNLRNKTLLLIHFVIIFFNDIIVIYTTMWFSQPSGIIFKKHGQALLTGLQYGTISLIIYTIIDKLRIKSKILGSVHFFKVSFIVIAITSLLTFIFYNNYTFITMAILVGFMNQFYRHTIYNHQSQNNTVFERCIQITERIQKIFVLCTMPAIVMIVLGRDDILDCLAWISGIAIIGFIASIISQRSNIDQQKAKMTTQQTVKVNKIE